MMKLAFVALAAFCLVGQISCRLPDGEVEADKVYLTKQKNLYQLYWHVDQPTLYFGKLYDIARNFYLSENINNYDDKEAVTEMIRYQDNKLFYPRGEVFSAMDPQVSRQAVLLYRILVSAKDYELFYNTAVWARFFINEGMFTYAFSVAMIQRPDTKFIKMPPLYEVLPHLFFNEDVMHRAYHIAMGDTADVIKPPSDIDTYILPTNYSGRYVPRDNTDEQAVNYFIEDVGLNSFYFLMNHHFPTFMATSYKTLNLQPKIRGEFYFFMHKQLMSRYYLERLSNGMSEIKPVSLDRPIKIGYYPTMHYGNGLRFPDRDTHHVVPVEVEKYTQKIKDLHSRIATAIDSGFVIDSKGKQVSIYNENGLNILGNIVQGNADTINQQTYGSLDLLSRRVLGFSMKSDDQYHLIPSALELFCTSLRDPIFFSMYRNILDYYHRYKENSPAYKPEELAFSSVRIDSVNVDKLITYFDKFDSMLNNGVSIRSQTEADNSITKARQQRLNHKPFTYHIVLRSDKNTKAVIRIFLGPKYDEFGNEYALKDNYMHFVELDQIITDLKVGVNTIDRPSYHSVYTVPDEMPSNVLYKKVVESLDGATPFKYHKQPYGFPERLVLPRGTPEGMEYKLFVVVSPFNVSNSVVVDSPVFGTVVLDGRPMGFPLDRPAEGLDFTSFNMIFKDVVIYHKEIEGMNVVA